MADKHIRGSVSSQEIREDHIVRDTRNIVTKAMHWMHTPSNLASLLVVMAAVAFLFPAVADFCLLFSLAFTAFGLTRKESAPLKLPIQSGMPDANERHPVTGDPTPASGIFFLGNELKTGKEVWLTNSDCRQHFLVLGTTGSGKALPLDARVHTPTGWKAMRDVRVGQTVSTPDGRSGTVIGYYPQGEVDICRLTFSDGRTAEACPNHLWEFLRDGDAFLLTTRAAAGLAAAGSAPLAVRLPQPVERPAAVLPFDAYETGRKLAAHLPVMAGETQPGARFHAAWTNTESCLKGSTVQRLEFLRGFAEAAGTIDAEGHAVFRCPDGAAADAVIEAVRSLGGIARLDPSGDGVTVLAAHPDPVAFLPVPGMDPASAARNAALAVLTLTSVETLRRAEAACILIDHPDHLFITDDYVVTHNTETLLGFAANAVTWGSGFLFCDGKGDVSLFAKVYALARRFGREDDLLVLNYMTGNQDLGSSGGKLRSNTLNPFATGSSDTLTQMVVGLMDDAGGDGAMWKGRATAMFTGVMRALTYLRDDGIVDLNVSEIRDHLNLKRIIDLADQAKYPDMPQPIRKSIKSYLSSLPGFQEDKGYRQSQTTLDQHGYLEMQFTKILGSLADVYGHIFHTPYGEIDMTDVVLNRRILVIMLPALEKSGDEIANLGKIVVATLKGMMGSTLGSEIEGDWKAVVDNRPTNSPTPFVVILDEVGYYMVDGMDLMAAQARSLGFSLVFAGQDLNAMKRLNEKVFGSVLGNTSTKLVMKTEDPDTAKIAIEAAGKAYRAQLGSYQGQVKEVGSRVYSDNLEARVEAVERINLRDLRDQDSGEMHVIFKDTVVRMKSFYAEPQSSLQKKNLVLRANHFITVAKPNPDDIASQQRLPEIVERIVDPAFAVRMKSDAASALKAAGDGSTEIAAIVRTLAEVQASRSRPSSPVEAACIAVARLAAENRNLNEGYSRDVRSGMGDDDRAQRMPPRAAKVPPQQFTDPAAFDGFLPDAPLDFEDPREAAADEARRAPARPPARPFASAGRVRRDIVHGVEAGGSVHDMADRISSNESVIKTLAALDFDEKGQTKAGVESAIEEALSISDDGEGEDVGPFDAGAVSRASSAAKAAMPDFDDEEDQGGDGGQQGSLVDDFLGALLSPEDED